MTTVSYVMQICVPIIVPQIIYLLFSVLAQLSVGLGDIKIVIKGRDKEVDTDSDFGASLCIHNRLFHYKMEGCSAT